MGVGFFCCFAHGGKDEILPLHNEIGEADCTLPGLDVGFGVNALGEQRAEFCGFFEGVFGGDLGEGAYDEMVLFVVESVGEAPDFGIIWFDEKAQAAAAGIAGAVF